MTEPGPAPPGRTALVVSESVTVARSVGEAIAGAGWSVRGVGPWEAPGGTLAAAPASTFEDAADALGGVAAPIGLVVACSDDDAGGPGGGGGGGVDPAAWAARVLARLRIHGAWSHAALRHRVRLVNLAGAAGSGTIVASAVGQLSRCLQEGQDPAQWQSHAVEVAGAEAAWALAGELAGWLGGAADAAGAVAGVELVVGDGWIGAKSPPGPVFTASFADSDAAPWLDEVLRLGVAGA